MTSFRHPQLHIFQFYLYLNIQEPLPLHSFQISFFKWKETSLNSSNNSSEPASWYVPHILSCFVSFLWTGSSWFPFVTHIVPSTVPCIWWLFDKCILHWMKKKTLPLSCKHWGTQRSGGLWWVEPMIKVAYVYCLLICTSHFLLNSLHSGFYSHHAIKTALVISVLEARVTPLSSSLSLLDTDQHSLLETHFWLLWWHTLVSFLLFHWLLFLSSFLLWLLCLTSKCYSVSELNHGSSFF